MTKEQALQLIDQAVSNISTTRKNHEALMLALKTLGSDNSVKKDDKKDV